MAFGDTAEPTTESAPDEPETDALFWIAGTFGRVEAEGVMHVGVESGRRAISCEAPVSDGITIDTSLLEGFGTSGSVGVTTTRDVVGTANGWDYEIHLASGSGGGGTLHF